MISFLVFSAGMARDILLKKPVPAKPWKKLISAEKGISVKQPLVCVLSDPFTEIFEDETYHSENQYLFLALQT